MTENKVALVLGGNGGIGRAIVKKLSSHGIKVYSVGLGDLINTEPSCSPPDNGIFLPCDVRDDASVCAVVHKVVESESKIDIFVNAVSGQLKLKTIEALSIDEYRDDMEVIALGGIRVCKQVFPEMKNMRAGVIIHMLTTAIIGEPPPRMSSYVAAKSGLNAFLSALAGEAVAFNIRVVGVSPSFVETSLLNLFPKKLLDIERQKQPDGMLLQPDDIAAVVSNIVLDPVKYPNGKNVPLYSRVDAKENSRVEA